ncbi:MAG: transporter substrate-binding domain-containing protein [Alphaproteobacteria bacterium]|nr:transporter substrate-binding domain-containing protein [Alphaproteobacteria bacterium]
MMKLHTKYLALLLLLVAIGGSAYWLSQRKTNPANQDGQLQRVRMAIVNNPVSALAVIAIEKGFFQREGIVIDSIPSTSGKMSIDIMLANQADVSLGGGPPFNFLSYSPHPLKVLSTTTYHYDTAVYARKDRAIASENDLRGKKIGYLPGTVSFIYWSRLLERHGWATKDFEMVPLQPPAMVSALVGGNVDAIVVWEPWGYNAMQQLGDNGIRFAEDKDYYWPGFFYGRNDFIDQNLDVIKGMIRAMLSSEEFLRNNPDEAIKIVANFVKIDPNHLKSFWNSYQFRVQLKPEFLEKLLVNDAIIKKFMPDYADKPVPDFKSFVDPEPLRAVAPDRVKDW